MIYKKCIMTIAKNTATLDEDIYLFRLDKNIELHFSIVNNKYKFDKSDLNNIIAQTNAAYFQIRLYRSDEIKYTFAIQPTQDGVAVLTITDDLINDPIEVGEYDFQISLLDADKTSMISMPIVTKQLHVCEPLVDNQAIMGRAVLGLSSLASGEIKNAFDSEGNYIREIHNDGDILSAQLVNKFEEALDANTKAIKNKDSNLPHTISSKVLVTVPASDITLEDDITINNLLINKDRRYYIEFLNNKKLCNLLIDEEEGNNVLCTIGNYRIQVYNDSTNMILVISKINEDDTTATTFTDLVIYEEEVKHLDNKYIENDLQLQNSISLGRIGDIGAASSAIGVGVTASGGASHAEGVNTIASNESTHAEGENTKAISLCSHAEGGGTIASGMASHAEGGATIASGKYSHTEGNTTIASGDYSHAEGYHTTASSQCQHVQGKFNIEDTNNKYAHIVGNGNVNNKSNAHTLDWQGNAWYAGKLTQEGTPTEDKDLVTKKYVNDNTIIHPLPIYKTTESPTMIMYMVNIMDLKKYTTYGAITDLNSTKYQRYRFIYICDDGKNKVICTTGDNLNDTTFRVSHYDTSSTLEHGNAIYSVDYTKHSTPTDVTIKITLRNYLGIYNSTEYTPEEDYNPATKKYVDDSKQIKYISPTDFANFVELTKEGGFFYVTTENLEFKYRDTTYPVKGLYDVRNSLYYSYNNFYVFYVNASNAIGVFESLEKTLTSYLDSMAGVDLKLDATNLLQLVNKKGEKIGAGITLPTPKISDTLVTTPITSNTLTLTKDKYQTATVVDGTEITLPAVTSFTEIHLFFSTTTDLTLTLPACKWQNGNTPTILANKTYEFIFTYTTEWLGGVIVYE